MAVSAVRDTLIIVLYLFAACIHPTEGSRVFLLIPFYERDTCWYNSLYCKKIVKHY